MANAYAPPGRAQTRPSLVDLGTYDGSPFGERQHERDTDHDGPGHRCLCGATFVNLRALAQHMPQYEPTPAELEHGPVLGNDNVCKCGQRFYSYRDLRAHGKEQA